MSVVVVTPPAATPISLDQAKHHLRVDHDDDNEQITMIIAAATATFDGPAATLGRSLMKQTLAMKLDAFPCAISNFDVWDRQRLQASRLPVYFEGWRSYLRLQQIPLPLPPVIGNVTVKYLDGSGVEQTLNPVSYRTLGVGSTCSRLALASGQSWPATEFIEESVTIQWDAGYGAAAENVPAPLRHAILLMIGHFYENRQSVYVDPSRVQAVELPQGVEALIAPYRVFI